MAVDLKAYLDSKLKKLRDTGVSNISNFSKRYGDVASGAAFGRSNAGRGLVRGASSVFGDFAQDVGSTGLTLGSEISRRIGSFDPLPNRVQSAYNKSAQYQAQKALDIRNKRGTVGSLSSGNPFQTAYKVGTGTGKATLGTIGLSSSPAAIGTSAGISSFFSAFNPEAGDTIPERVAYGVGQSPMFTGMGSFSRSLTNPLLSRFAPKLGTTAGSFGGRLVGSLGNVAEGIGFDKATGMPTTPTSLAIDATTGLLGGIEAPNAKQANFAMDKNTRNELEEAYIMLTKPDSFIGKIDTGARTKKEATKIIQERAQDTIDRIAGKYLPDKELNRLKTPKVIAEKLFDLSEQNKLANVPGMGLVDTKSKAQQPATKASMQFEKDMVEFNKKPFSKTETKPIKIRNKYDDDVAITTAVIKEIDDTPNNRFTGSVRSFLNPIKNLGEESQRTVTNWRSKVLESNSKANKVFSDFETKFKGIQGKDGLKYFDAIESGNTKNLVGAEELRTHLDSERQRALDAGLDVKYLNNYLNHVWNNTQEQIVKARSLSRNLPANREIPTYKEGVALGLTPKYTSPSQLAAHYTRAVDLAIANKELVDNLISSEKLLTRSQARNAGLFDWKSIDAPFFPKAKTIIGKNKELVEDYVASPELAKTLNNIFEDKTGNVILNFAANLSKKVQDVSLSGGVPYTPLNAFSFANAVKEVQSGRFKSPVKAFITSTLGDGASQKYFKENAEYTQAMARQGIPSYNNVDFRSAYQKSTENMGRLDTFKQKLGDGWNKAISESTFKRFIPMLQVEFYKDTYEGLVKNGMTPKQAEVVAGNATKNFYGIVDTFSRSKNNEDFLSTVFFAPRFREAMVNFWGKNLQALNPKNLGKQEYLANQKYIAGTILTYALMSATNKALTGHYSHENKGGKELAMEVPIGGGRSWFIPLNPSMGTVPRRVVEGVGELLSGDVAGATSKAGSFFSQPVSTGSQLFTNRTFYGGPIYNQDDPGITKVGKLAGYGFEQLAHPYLGEPLAVSQGRKKPITGLLNALELPFYESQSTSVSHLKGKQVTKYKELYAKNPLEAQKYSQTVLKAKSPDKTNQNQGILSKLFNKDSGSEDVGQYFYDEEGETKTIDTSKVSSMPSKTNYEKALKESESYKLVDDIIENLEGADRTKALKDLEINEQDASYYVVASQTEEVRRASIDDFISNSKDRNEMLGTLAAARIVVNGKKVLTDGIIDDLYNEGLISSAEKKYLKNLDYDSKGKLKAKKGKTVKMKVKPMPKTIKANIAKIQLPKRAYPQFENPQTLRVKPKQLLQLSQPTKLKSYDAPTFNI